VVRTERIAHVSRARHGCWLELRTGYLVSQFHFVLWGRLEENDRRSHTKLHEQNKSRRVCRRGSFFPWQELSVTGNVDNQLFAPDVFCSNPFTIITSSAGSTGFDT